MKNLIIANKYLGNEITKFNEDTNLKYLSEFTTIAMLGIIPIEDVFFNRKN